MGVQGLTSYVSQNLRGSFSKAVITQPLTAPRTLELLIDYSAFVIYHSQLWNDEILRAQTSPYGEYEVYHLRITKFVQTCAAYGITLVITFFGMILHGAGAC